MSMNADHENFDALRRLLKLKRHEQPPPGYFNRLPGQVIARIQAGAAADSHEAMDGLLWGAPWLRRLLALFEAKPALVGACAAILGAGLIAGFVSLENNDTHSLPWEQSSAGSQLAKSSEVPASAFASGAGFLMKISSTNPVTPAGGSIFDSFPRPETILTGGRPIGGY